MQWYINLLIQAHIQIRGITIRTGDLFTDSPRKSFFFKKRILGEAFDDLSALMSISLMMPIYPNQVSYFQVDCQLFDVDRLLVYIMDDLCDEISILDMSAESLGSNISESSNLSSKR